MARIKPILRVILKAIAALAVGVAAVAFIAPTDSLKPILVFFAAVGVAAFSFMAWEALDEPPGELNLRPPKS